MVLFLVRRVQESCENEEVYNILRLVYTNFFILHAVVEEYPQKIHVHPEPENVTFLEI
jgi:hypothetical protein